MKDGSIILKQQKNTSQPIDGVAEVLKGNDLLAATPKVSVRNVTQAFRMQNGTSNLTLENFTLDMMPGEFISIVGPSGCGKTTLLNIISGLLAPTEGAVYIDGELVQRIHENIGYMPARDALLPWRTVVANVAFGLEFRRQMSRAHRLELATSMLDRVGLKGFENQYVSQLSHGMRQRVAIARTFVSSPEILLLDEPFSALDAQTRVRMQELFLELWEAERKTVMLVTHDVTEAISLADRVVVLSQRPARTKSIFSVDLTRPRKVRQIHRDTKFQDMLEQVWDLLDY